MSNTYTLLCDTCKVKHWAGQSDHLYSSAAKFLHEHMDSGRKPHSLRFILDFGFTEREDPSNEYKEIEYPDGDIARNKKDI